MKVSVGYTLIEVTISLLLSMMILSSVTIIFCVAKKSHNAQLNLISNLEESRFALRVMLSEIHQSGCWGCVPSSPELESKKILPYFDSDMKPGTQGISFFYTQKGHAEKNDFFIAKNNRNHFSLYEKNSRGHRQELVENIEEMEVHYLVSQGGKIREVVSSFDQAELLGVGIRLSVLGKNYYMFGAVRDGVIKK